MLLNYSFTQLIIDYNISLAATRGSVLVLVKGRGEGVFHSVLCPPQAAAIGSAVINEPKFGINPFGCLLCLMCPPCW